MKRKPSLKKKLKKERKQNKKIQKAQKRSNRPLWKKSIEPVIGFSILIGSGLFVYQQYATSIDILYRQQPIRQDKEKTMSQLDPSMLLKDDEENIQNKREFQSFYETWTNNNLLQKQPSKSDIVTFKEMFQRITEPTAKEQQQYEWLSLQMELAQEWRSFYHQNDTKTLVKTPQEVYAFIDTSYQRLYEVWFQNPTQVEPFLDIAFNKEKEFKQALDELNERLELLHQLLASYNPSQIIVYSGQYPNALKQYQNIVKNQTYQWQTLKHLDFIEERWVNQLENNQIRHQHYVSYVADQNKKDNAYAQHNRELERIAWLNTQKELEKQRIELERLRKEEEEKRKKEEAKRPKPTESSSTSETTSKTTETSTTTSETTSETTETTESSTTTPKENYTIPSFLTITEVEEWSKDKKIEVVYQYKEDDNHIDGFIFDVNPKTNIEEGDTLYVTVNQRD